MKLVGDHAAQFGLEDGSYVQVSTISGDLLLELAQQKRQQDAGYGVGGVKTEEEEKKVNAAHVVENAPAAPAAPVAVPAQHHEPPAAAFDINAILALEEQQRRGTTADVKPESD